MSADQQPQYARSWDLDDIQILRAKDGHGDGRTVEAYAAVFDKSTEIRDKHGHYRERIARTAFNRQLGIGVDRVYVLYNHGLTMHGTPASGEGSVPVGTPLSVTADGRGLRTVTRYNEGAFVDTILEAIRNDGIKGYSFRGGIFGSDPTRVPKTRPGQPLPVVTRTQLGLMEYGPTPSPYYTEASIIALRAAIQDGTSDGIAALRQLLEATPWGIPDQARSATPEGPGDKTDEDQLAHSRRIQQMHLALKRGMRQRGM